MTNTLNLPLVPCRLTESESTVQKRLAWAQQQASAAAAPGLFNFSIQDKSCEAAYDSLQQAVATLSPAVRTKLLGLPADVLDYADLIASSSVEEPVLKPVLLAGGSLSSLLRKHHQVVFYLLRQLKAASAKP